MTDDERAILDRAHQVRTEGYATWPLDKLLLNPAKGLALCSEVRRRLHPRLRERATDEAILGLLLNQRKRGRRKAARDQTARPGRGDAGNAARRSWATGPRRR